MKKLTDKEKEEVLNDITKKLMAILAVNNLAFEGLDAKVWSSLIMAYQQGMKDAKDLLK